MILTTQNEEETLHFAESMAKSLHGGEVLALRGDLGSGKTTFTKGLARGLGIKAHITSPTFLIVKKYSVEKEAITTLYHLDLYRLQTIKEIDEIGIKDILSAPQTVTVIEWSERMGELLPKKYLQIAFEYAGEDKRKITVKDYR